MPMQPPPFRLPDPLRRWSRLFHRRPPTPVLPPLLENDRTAVVMHLRRDMLRSYVSPSCRDILGYAPSELMGGHPRAVIHPDDWPRIRLLLALCRRTAEPVRDTHRVLHKSGRLLWMEGCYAPRPDGGFTVLLHAITPPGLAF
ncbi:MAG: PAS domain-containing protein [Gluconacetobacter diazotrophicus]|nr:PAS domain-containing protein [Gluconacetobacter diazotrophicus]